MVSYKEALSSLCLTLLVICITWAKSNHQRTKRPKQAVPLIGCDLRARKVTYPEFLARCPPKCIESKQPVYGSGVYASISSLCNAAIHSGVITDKGGKVMVRKTTGQPFYKGSMSHGVRSLSLPRWKESFTVAVGKTNKSIIYPFMLFDAPALLTTFTTATSQQASPPTTPSMARTTSPTTTDMATTTLDLLTMTRVFPTPATTTSTTTTVPRPTTTTATPGGVGAAPWPPSLYHPMASTHDIPPFPVDLQWDDELSMKDWPFPLYLYPDWFTHRGHTSGLQYFPPSRPLLSVYDHRPSFLGRLSAASRQQAVGRAFRGTSDENRGCEVDVTFLIDGGWNIGGRRFQIQKDFLVNMTRAIGVGVASPLMGVVQYGDDAITEFGLKVHLKPLDLKRAIEHITQRGGLSNVGKALTYTYNNVFTDGNGNRGRAPDVAVVLVDGWSSDRVNEALRLAQGSGVNVFLVSVEGRNAGDRETMPEADFEEKVKCRPGRFFSLSVASWFVLRDAVQPLAERVCATENLPCSRACWESHELVFVVGSSSSRASFTTLLAFVSNVTQAFHISPTDTRVGLVQYTHDRRLEIGLGQCTSKDELEDAILGVRYLGGGTSIGAAVTFSTKHLSYHSRAGEQKVIVLVTDGRSHDNVVAPALAARQIGVIIYSVGVAWAVQEELEDMASDPVKEHSFYVEDFDLLYKLPPTIIQNICREFDSKAQS